MASKRGAPPKEDLHKKTRLILPFEDMNLKEEELFSLPKKLLQHPHHQPPRPRKGGVHWPRPFPLEKDRKEKKVRVSFN